MRYIFIEILASLTDFMPNKICLDQISYSGIEIKLILIATNFTYTCCVYKVKKRCIPQSVVIQIYRVPLFHSDRKYQSRIQFDAFIHS